jgi:hypothetical protein
MSRLNYLTDEELALDGIDQELRLLERLVAKGLKLDASQLTTLADCRDRISRLLAPLPNSSAVGKADTQPVRPASSRPTQAAELQTEDPSVEELRQSIRKLLDEAVA